MKEPGRRKNLFNFDSIVAVCSILIALFLIHNEYNMPTTMIRQIIGPSFMPIAILVALIFSALLILFTSLRTNRKPEGTVSAAAELPAETSAGQYKVMAMLVLGLLVYAVILIPVGFIISTIILILWQAQIFERGKWIRNLVVSIVFSVLVYYLFAHILEVMLPTGILSF